MESSAGPPGLLEPGQGKAPPAAARRGEPFCQAGKPEGDGGAAFPVRAEQASAVPPYGAPPQSARSLTGASLAYSTLGRGASALGRGLRCRASLGQEMEEEGKDPPAPGKT